MLSSIITYIKGAIDPLDESTPEDREWIEKIDAAIKSQAPLTIYKNNEAGIEQWSIVDPVESDYWLNSFDTIEEAKQWCDALDLKYEN